MKVIFLLEVIPHYRIDFFNQLSERGGVVLIIIVPKGTKEKLSKIQTKGIKFTIIELDTKYIKSGRKYFLYFKNLTSTVKKTRPDILVLSSNFRYIQNTLLFLMKAAGRYKILYWTHGTKKVPSVKSYKHIEGIYNKIIDSLFVDGFLVYTHDSDDFYKSIKIPENKIFIFNNTINVEKNRETFEAIREEEIRLQLEKFKIENEKNIVFIGRLIEKKSPQVVINYWLKLRKIFKDLGLIMIGDGPLLENIKKLNYKNLTAIGGLYDEKVIACLMKASLFVFCPTYSGLNINHAFSYGKPFVTFESNDHGPEIVYVRNGENGLILNPNSPAENIRRITAMISCRDEYEKYSRTAWETGSTLTLSNMVHNCTEAFTRVL